MLIHIRFEMHDIIGYNFSQCVLISFKFISQHYEDGSFIVFKYLVSIIKNQLTVTLQKSTIFTMLIHIRFEGARYNWL